MFKSAFFKMVSLLVFTLLVLDCDNRECKIPFSDEEYELIHEGQVLQAKGRFEDAIGKYQDVLELNKGNYIALSNLASCIYEEDNIQTSKNRISSCLDYLEDAIALCPSFEPSYTNIITITSDYQIANLAVYYGYLHDSIFGATCYTDIKRAKSYLDLGDTLRTKLIIDRQISLGCREPDLYLLAAEYFQKVDDSFTAENILEEVLKENPYNDIALTASANLLRLKGEIDEAEILYKEALLYNSSNFEANFGLSELYFNSDDEDSGCAYLTAARRFAGDGLFSILYRSKMEELSNNFCNKIKSQDI